MIYHSRYLQPAHKSSGASCVLIKTHSVWRFEGMCFCFVVSGSSGFHYMYRHRSRRSRVSCVICLLFCQAGKASDSIRAIKRPDSPKKFGLIALFYLLRSDMPTEEERVLGSTPGYTVEFLVCELIVPEQSHAIHGNGGEINVYLG